MMVWHSSRISLTALLQTSIHLQRDVARLDSKRKATKLKKEMEELPYERSLKIDYKVFSLERRKLRGNVTQF